MDDIDPDMGQWDLNSAPSGSGADDALFSDDETQFIGDLNVQRAPSQSSHSAEPEANLNVDGPAPESAHHPPGENGQQNSEPNEDEEDDEEGVQGNEGSVGHGGLDAEDMDLADQADGDDIYGAIGDDNSDAGVDDTYVGECVQKCKPAWQAVHGKSQDRKTRLRRAYERDRQQQQIIWQLRKENRELRKRVEELEHGPQRRIKATWRTVFEDWIYKRPQPGRITWEDIYTLSCREENASPDPRKIHPDLSLRGPTPQELRRPRHREGGLRTAAGPPYPTSRLPQEIQAVILRYALCFPGRVVHAISRLDPWNEPASPEELPRGNDGRYRLLHRFHIGDSPVSLTFATLPDALLAPLLVCRAWTVWGCELFYGKNIFCFSSLGELGRFSRGIGNRWQRIQHVEFLWLGSQRLTFAPSARGKATSRRTLSLKLLAEARRLKLLTVHVQEYSKEYMRRRHEPRRIIRYMEAKTREQPNYRMFRSLRNLQGLDYVHCLRGLEHVAFYDFDEWLTKKQKKPIRDETFLLDIHNTVQQPKTDFDLVNSGLRELTPLLRAYSPPESVWRSLLAAYDDDRRAIRPRTIIDESAESTQSDSDSDSNSDSDSDPDSSPGSSGSGTMAVSYAGSAGDGLESNIPHSRPNSSDSGSTSNENSDADADSDSEGDSGRDSGSSSDSDPDSESPGRAVRSAPEMIDLTADDDNDNDDGDNDGDDDGDGDDDDGDGDDDGNERLRLGGSESLREAVRSTPETIDLTAADDDADGGTPLSITRNATVSSGAMGPPPRRARQEGNRSQDGGSNEGSESSGESSLFVRDDTASNGSIGGGALRSPLSRGFEVGAFSSVASRSSGGSRQSDDRRMREESSLFVGSTRVHSDRAHSSSTASERQDTRNLPSTMNGRDSVVDLTEDEDEPQEGSQTGSAIADDAAQRRKRPQYGSSAGPGDQRSKRRRTSGSPAEEQ